MLHEDCKLNESRRADSLIQYNYYTNRKCWVYGWMTSCSLTSWHHATCWASLTLVSMVTMGKRGLTENSRSVTSLLLLQQHVSSFSSSWCCETRDWACLSHAAQTETRKASLYRRNRLKSPPASECLWNNSNRFLWPAGCGFKCHSWEILSQSLVQ